MSDFDEMDARVEATRRSWTYKRAMAWLWLTGLISGVFWRPWDGGLGDCYNWCGYGREETACRTEACGPMPLHRFLATMRPRRREDSR